MLLISYKFKNMCIIKNKNQKENLAYQSTDDTQENKRIACHAYFSIYINKPYHISKE